MTTEIITQTITSHNECGECDNKCGVCGQRLAYATVTRSKTCAVCNKEETSAIGCPDGHYICRECDSKKALETIDRILATTKETSPVNIIELVMANPEICMHGAVHYELVPAAILTAVGNTGYELPADAIAEARARARQIPDGASGFFGICGAALGVGIAVSLLTGATAFSGEARHLALTATSYTASHMLGETSPCGLRESRTAALSAAEFIRDFLQIDLPRNQRIRCVHLIRNNTCAEEKCPFFVAHGTHELSASYVDG